MIKTNLVPFTRGVLQAIARGTFTVGHGAKVAEQRNKKSLAPSLVPPQVTMDRALIAKGTQFLENVRSRN